MNIYFKWKELTSDGLLKEPATEGPYYEEDVLNGYEGGFESEKGAEEALSRWFKKYRMSPNYVLVKVYCG